MEKGNRKYLKTILFSELGKWYVSYYLNPYLVKSNFELVRISNIIKPAKNRIKKSDFDGQLNVVSKISFNDGQIHLRQERKTGMDLYRLNLGQLLVSKINFHQGAVAINKINELACSTHYQPYDVNYEKVNSTYLTQVLRSNGFLNFVKYLRADGIKNEATFEFIGNLEIPLPSLEEQNRIILAYNNKIEHAKDLEEKACQLEKDIETYLFDELEIKKKKEKRINDGLNFISFKDTSVWGVEKLLKGTKSNILESNRYPNKVLSQVTSINPTTDISNLKDEDEMSFIPMMCVSDDYGEIIELYDGVKGNSKGYTKFKNGDLIWARITPCMQNGKSAVVDNLKNGLGYGSTEYHVVREKHKDVLINYVYHLLRSHAIRKDATIHFTGSAGQQRVPKSYLENLIIPVPPVEIQNKIISTINQMKFDIKELDTKAKEKREQATKDFESEIFIND